MVSESMVLRRIFGPEKDEVTGEWSKLHNEELKDLYSSPSICRMIKSGITMWTVHVAFRGGGGEGEAYIEVHLQEVEWGTWTR
jgi:hypothetical protein